MIASPAPPSARRRAHAAATLLMLAAAAGPVTAQPVDLPAAQTATEVDPVVVSPQRRAGRRFEAAASVGAVPARQAQAMAARSLPETLEESTAVSVQVTNRGAGAPILRGLIGPSNMMVVDGMRYHQSTWRTGPNQYLATLDLSAVAQIEVLHGSQSVAYGSSAMGGVLAVAPWELPSAAGLSGAATLRFTSADRAAEAWGRASLRRGAFSALVAGGYRRFGELRLGGGEVAPISAYSQGGWLGRFGYDLSERTQVRLSAFGNRLQDAGRADSLHQGDLRWYDNADDMAWLDVEHKGAAASVVDGLRASFALHRSDEVARRVRCKLTTISADAPACVDGAEALQADPDSAPAALVTRENRNQDIVTTLGGLLRVALRPLGGAARRQLRVDVGAELWRDGIDTSSASERRSDKGWSWADSARGQFSAGSSFTELGAFALADAELLRRGGLRLMLDAGARYASFQAQAADVPGVGDIAYSAGGLVGSAGLRALGERAMGYFSWHQGLRAPNLQETTVLGDTGGTFEVPNADLGPERSDAFELGGRVQLAALSVHAAVWRIHLQDVIDQREVPAVEYGAFGIDTATIGDKPVRQRVNKAKATLEGAQLEVRGRLPLGLQPWARVAATVGDVLEDDGTTSPLRRIPPLGGAAGLLLQRARWSAEVYARFAAAQDRVSSGDEGDLRICEDPAAPGKTYKAGGKTCPGTPGWADLGVRGGVALSDGLRLDAVVRNLLDASYRTHGSGIDAPGVSGSLALSGRF